MKVLVVDDEKPARDRLQQLLEDFDDCELVGSAGNGEQAVSMAGELNPDVVLLDIRMPGLNGIEVAHHLNLLPAPPAIVFTTAYDEYAIEAFEAQAIGYVLKPVRRERLGKALAQAARLGSGALEEIADASQVETRRKHVCARSQDQLKLIPVEDVRYFRADQKYVCVYHAGGEDLIDDSLKSLEQEFGDEFVRIHRSAIVALTAIERIEKTIDGKQRVVLRDGSQEADEGLIISRRHLADVRRRLRGG